jgi:hypothetical protein
MTAADVPTRVRRFVAVLLGLLLLAGLVGVEAWPLTGWRLFSLTRGPEHVHWEIDAIDADGDETTVDLDRLPMAYHLAEWPLADLADAGDAQREAVCQALLGGVRDEVPGAVGLRIVRNHQRMVERDGEFEVVGDREPLHECGRGEGES